MARNRAEIPPLMAESADQCPERALLVWSPSTNISEASREFSHSASNANIHSLSFRVYPDGEGEARL